MIGDDAEEIVYQILMDSPQVVAVIGEKNAHENIIPEDAGLPAIAYTRSATQYNTGIHGSESLAQDVTIEIACLGRSAKEARELRKLVDAISTPDWVKVGCASVYDIETKQHEQIVTVVVTEQ